MKGSNRALVLSVVLIQLLSVCESCIKESLMQAICLISSDHVRHSGVCERQVEDSYQLVRQRSPMTESLRDPGSTPLSGGRLLDNAYCISLGDVDLMLAQILADEAACYIPLLLCRRNRRTQSPFFRDRFVDRVSFRFCLSLPGLVHCTGCDKLTSFRRHKA